MAKPFLTFNTEDAYEEAVQQRIDTELKSAEDEIAALKAKNDELAENLATAQSSLADLQAKSATRSSPVVDKFAAFAEHPAFHAAISATDLLPTSLPTLAAFEVFKGATKASAIQAIIPATNAVGGRGGGATTAASIAKAIKTAAVAFIEANKGVGIKVSTIRGAKGIPGDAEVRVFKFRPIEEIVDAPAPESEESTEKEPDQQQSA